jgi:hypothetical protein
LRNRVGKQLARVLPSRVSPRAAKPDRPLPPPACPLPRNTPARARPPWTVPQPTTQGRMCVRVVAVPLHAPPCTTMKEGALVRSQGQGSADAGLGVRLALPRSIASTGRATGNTVVRGDNHPREGARCDFKQDPCGCSKRHWSSAQGRVGTRTEQGRNWLWRLNTLPCSTTTNNQ